MAADETASPKATEKAGGQEPDEEPPPHAKGLPDRPELLRLYELQIQEYRFQVQLNWDRTKHYIVVNGTVVGIAAALAKAGASPSVLGLIALLLLLAALNCFLGAYAIRLGHTYYREIRRRKTVFEKALGLLETRDGVPPGSFAIGTTSGMAAEIAKAQGATDARSRGWMRTITGQTIALLILMGTGSAVGSACMVREAWKEHRRGTTERGAASPTPATAASSQSAAPVLSPLPSTVPPAPSLAAPSTSPVASP